MASYKTALEQAVPNSTGTAPPNTPSPVNAADCHIHIYDPRFAPVVTHATIGDYRLLQKRMQQRGIVLVRGRGRPHPWPWDCRAS